MTVAVIGGNVRVSMRSLARGTLAAAAIAGLQLLGWALARPGGFASAPARPAAIVVMAAFAFAYAPSFRIGGRAHAESHAQHVMLAALAVFVPAGLVATPWLDARDDLLPWLRLDSPALRSAGVVVLALGAALQVWTVLTLGALYTPRVAILPGHTLVTSGPYGVVRHPFYAGALAMILGFPSAYGLWAGLPAAVLALPPLVWRMNAEERLLSEEFGEAYELLRARTKRLVPFVY